MSKSETKPKEEQGQSNVQDVEKVIDNDKDMRQWPQYAAAFCAACAPATMGCNVSFSSQLVTDLQQEDGHMRMTLEEASWIPSLYMAGAILAGPLSGFLANRYGRRPVLCYGGLPVVASLMLISFSTLPSMLLAGRVIAGISTGMVHSISIIYISETSSPGIRKTVGCFPSLFMSIGMFATYSAGFVFPWRTVSLLLIAFPLFLSISLWFLPETPYWLVEAGKKKEAGNSLTFFRGPKFDISSELAQITEKKNEKLKQEFNSKNKGLARSICSLNFLLPFICIAPLYGLGQFNGIAVVVVYMADVFQMSGTTIDHKMAPMFVGLTRVFASCCTIVILRKVPKKYLFIVCTLVLALGMSCIGGFSHLKYRYPEHTELAKQLDFLPMLGTALACLCMSLGVLPTLQIQLSEVFPTDIRSVAVGIVQVSYGILHAIGAKTFPTFLELFHFHGTFYIFAAINVCMAVWAGFTMVNVDGLNLVEVENKYEMMRVNTLRSVKSLGERSRSMASLKTSKSGSSVCDHGLEKGKEL